MILRNDEIQFIEKVEPLCPVFGQCGGCLYQDIPYEKELKIKEKQLRLFLQKAASIPEERFDPIVPSPEPYHYRNRLDLKLVRTKNQECFIGFSSEKHNRHVPIARCFIARDEISQFLSQLKPLAVSRLTPKYRQANLVVRTGQDGRVFWGGIGRRSLELKEEDYLWTVISGRKIFYSLDTFFQANLSILPVLFEKIESLNLLNQETCLLDLYGGVGLFSFGLIDQIKRSVLLEDCPASLKLARFNAAFHDCRNIDIISGKVEERLSGIIDKSCEKVMGAIIDPPREGLSPKAAEMLAGLRNVHWILYLSCHPESLSRDLEIFIKNDWTIEKVIPFDFFPKTKHLETLVVLSLSASRIHETHHVSRTTLHAS